MGSLLLDTCAALWLAQGDSVAAAALAALDESYQEGRDVYVSPITAWEIGMLSARGRLSSQIRPELLFQRFLKIPTVRLADMLPEVLIASSFLPGSAPRDPADRIIAATAREYGYTIMTRDRGLRDYAEEGHVKVLVC